MVATDFGQVETRQFVISDAPRERLRTLAQQLRGRAAEHEEPGGQGIAVREYAKDRKQGRAGLDFIKDDEAAERLQSQHRLVEPRQIPGIFQIEAGHAFLRGAFPGGGKLQRERSLPHLPRTEECDDGIVAQFPCQSVQVGGSGDDHV